jgi:diamine N-acetyltransferase
MFARRMQIKEFYKDRIDFLDDKIEELEDSFSNLQRYIEYFRSKGCEVIGVEEYQNEWFVIYRLKTDASLYVMLNNLTKFRADWIFGILSSYYSNYDYKRDAESKYIHIGDIQGSEINRGYGSILMKYLQDEAIKDNITHIQGEIISRDFGHVFRLKHFYEKHGFEVELDFDKECGEIRWLNENSKF